MIWYDMIWYDMIWYDMIWYVIYIYTQYICIIYNPIANPRAVCCARIWNHWNLSLCCHCAVPRNQCLWILRGKGCVGYVPACAMAPMAMGPWPRPSPVKKMQPLPMEKCLPQVSNRKFWWFQDVPRLVKVSFCQNESCLSHSLVSCSLSVLVALDIWPGAKWWELKFDFIFESELSACQSATIWHHLLPTTLAPALENMSIYRMTLQN